MLRYAMSILLVGLCLYGWQSLRAAEPQDVFELAKGLRHKDAKVRLRTAKALGDMGNAAREATPALIALLTDADWSVRMQATKTLAQIGPPAIPALVKRLKDENPVTRSGAAQGLARMGPDAKSAVAPLIATLEDKDKRVRVGAIMALGEIGPEAKAAVRVLSELSKDRDDQLRLTAELALAKIDPPQAGDGRAALNLQGPVGSIAVQMTATREAQLDQLINAFILADTGRLPGPADRRLLVISTFHAVIQQVGPDAIPALVRGTNRAMVLGAYDCPGDTLVMYLAAMLPMCNDPSQVEYAIQNLGLTPGGARPTQDVNFKLYFQIARQVAVRRKAELILMSIRQEAIKRLIAEVAKLGESELKENLKDERPEMRWASIWVAAGRRLQWQDALIDRLADPSPDVREAARQALVRLSRGTDFGPAPNAKPADRDKAIAKWRDWWAMQDDNPKNKKDGGTTLQTADAEDGKQKEADRLAEAAVKGTSQERADALAKLQAGKGGPYTLALSVAIAKLEGDGKAEARRALVERLTRLTAGTLAQYLESEDAELRRAAALALAAKEDTSQVPKLIALLEDREPLAARAAHAALKALAGQDFGPARDATAEQRAEAVKKWRQWWEKQKEGKK